MELLAILHKGMLQKYANIKRNGITQRSRFIQLNKQILSIDKDHGKNSSFDLGYRKLTSGNENDYGEIDGHKHN